MRIELALLILVSVLLSSGSQVLLKLGMSAPDVQIALAHSDRPLRIATSIVSSIPVLVGLASFGLSAVVWLFVLSKIPVSAAYPFVALGIAITVASGSVLFGEAITIAKGVGIVLIITGVLTIGMSS